MSTGQTKSVAMIFSQDRQTCYHSSNMSGTVLQCAIATLSLRCTAPFLTYSTCRYAVTLKRGLRVIIGSDTDQSAPYDFLLTFHINYGPVSYRFRDASLWNLVSAHGGKKTRTMGLPADQKKFEIWLAV